MCELSQYKWNASMIYWLILISRFVCLYSIAVKKHNDQYIVKNLTDRAMNKLSPQENSVCCQGSCIFL